MQTAFGDALARAGMDTQPTRLAVAATNILQRNKDNFLKALGQFQEIIDGDRMLRHALAAAYLQDRANDMRGDGLRGDGHIGAGTHVISAAPQLNEGVEGQRRSASATECMPPTPSSVRSEERHKDCVARAVHAPPPKPNPPRGLAAIASIQPTIAKTILDTFRVRDGRAIGDLQWFELIRIAASNEAEARVLRYVADHAANVRADAKVRDIVKPDVVEKAVKHAEAVNVAA